MGRKHYLKVRFSLTKDNSPAIYDFFWKHLQPTLEQLGIEEVRIRIERLEPIDCIYTNLNMSENEIREIFDNFAKCHHLREEPAINFEKEKTNLHAKLKTGSLSAVLQDYNILFDLFFADLIIEGGSQLTIEMMDGFSNSLTASGEKETLEKFKGILKKRMPGTTFEYHE